MTTDETCHDARQSSQSLTWEAPSGWQRNRASNGETQTTHCSTVQCTNSAIRTPNPSYLPGVTNQSIGAQHLYHVTYSDQWARALSLLLFYLSRTFYHLVISIVHACTLLTFRCSSCLSMDNVPCLFGRLPVNLILAEVGLLILLRNWSFRSCNCMLVVA